MSKKIPTTDTPEQKADRKRYAVLERRLMNPLGEPSAPIDMKDPERVCRWFNSAIMADKIWRAKAKGWDPVRPQELKDPDQVGGFNPSPDGFVTRGDRGQEVLMSMPRDWQQQIQWAKTAANNKNMGNPDATKREIVAAAGDRLGDEAASGLEKRMSIIGGVTDNREIVENVGNLE